MILTLFFLMAISILLTVIFFLKRKNNELKNTCRENLNMANKKSIFLATMSHEIRTPLNGILVASKLMNSERLNDNCRELNDIILNSSELLANVVNDILDFSKLDAGKFELDFKYVDLENLINSVLFTFKSQFKDKGLKLEFKIGSEINQKVYIDEVRVKQVLYNLIGNAYKFTTEGGVYLTVELCPSKKMIEIKIKDTGIGIPPEKLEKIFEEYGQVDNTTQTKFGGTGLGLSISKTLSELMGGTIIVGSKLNEGTEFCFTIPYQVLTGKIIDTIKEKDISHNQDFGQLSILVADDNPMNRKVAELTFKKKGIKLDLACDGEEAVSMATNGNYDLIFMDIQMPKLSGIEASEKLIEIIPYNNLPLIYGFSASVFKEVKDQAINAGMSGFISKPINLEKLNEPLTQALKRKTTKNAA